jgi:3-methylcrotonyl-CoA carboxylase alpha subunit
MHGKIIDLLVGVNEKVEQGQPLLILEAMKMEHSLKAPAKGIVNAFLCKPGDNVESDQVLVDFTADEANDAT